MRLQRLLMAAAAVFVSLLVSPPAIAAGAFVTKTVQDGTGTHTTSLYDVSGVGTGPFLPVGVCTDGAGNVCATSVTPTLSASTLTMTSATTAYAAGQLIASSATVGSIVNPSFSMPTLGGAIPRLRLSNNDTTSTAWGGVTIQVDLWSSPPTWTNGDRGVWLPATGAGFHYGGFSCTMSAVWGDGTTSHCLPNIGNYANIPSGPVYWSLQAVTASGVTGASKVWTLSAELN